MHHTNCTTHSKLSQTLGSSTDLNTMTVTCSQPFFHVKVNMLLLIYLFCIFICIIPASNSSLGNCWLGNWWLLQIWDWDWSVSPYGQFNHLWQQWQCCRNLLVCHTPVFPQPVHCLIHPYPLLLCVYGFCHFYALKLSMKLAWTWIQSITW